MLKSTLLEAAKMAGKIMKDNFESDFKVSSKDAVNDLVTEIDKKCEKEIIAIIQKEFPEHEILSEEIGRIEKPSAIKWIIDPIDGTANYAHGLPICCVSIAVEKAGEVILGAVYNPFYEELYFAEKGNGATCNGKAISVSDNAEYEKGFLVTGFPPVFEKACNSPFKIFEQLIRDGLPVRRLGSAAMNLCWVAAGKFDGYWQQQLQPWDTAAGFLMVEEAGGKVTDFHGDRYSLYQDQLLATNQKLHKQLLKTINR